MFPTCDSKELIDDIHRVAEIVRQTPTCIQYDKLGKFGTAYASEILAKGTRNKLKWKEACHTANLIPHSTHEGNGRGTRIYISSPSGNSVCFRSTYEVRLASVLTQWNEPWKAHFELEPLFYMKQNGKHSKYLPDFYLPDKKLFLETKGWFNNTDKQKMKAVIISNPDMK